MKSKIFPTIKSKCPNDEHILVLFGGLGKEREVSVSSSRSIIETLPNMGYDVTAVDMGVDIASVIESIKPDLVFNIMHGLHGEDGSIQGILDILSVPYTHSGLLASAVAFDKILSQAIFMQNGIKCPERMILSKNDIIIGEPMPRPYVIKPISQGSSIGVNVIFEGDNFCINDYDFLYGDKVIVEKYIKGREIQVAIIGNKAVGTLEIIPLKRRFYDYDTKYTDGMAKHICPAILPKESEEKLLKIAEKVHNLINCRNISRVEFRYDEDGDGEFYLLEINTHPGFTPISIVPEIAAKNNISFEQLLKILIDDAYEVAKKYKKEA